MSKRKQIIVDRDFQFKTTFKILGIIIFLLAIIAVGIGIHAANNNKKLEKTILKLEDIITDQDHIVEALKGYSNFSNEKETRIASKTMSNNLVENIRLMKKNTFSIHSIIRMNNLIIIIVLIFIVAQGFILYFYIIRKTNTISGPVFVMSNHIRRILSGEESEIRSLREDDQFKELYDLLMELTESYIEEKRSK